MVCRGLGPVLAAIALLAGCGRGEPDAAAERAKATSPAAELVAPVAPLDEASASPSPEPNESASPTPSPSVPAIAAVAYPPSDECARLPGFPAFRDKVFAAVKARDADALAALADPKINLDFGGGAGRDELKTRLSDPKLRLWDEVAAVSALGCAADGGIATMPWIFSRLPESFDDASITMLGVGPGLPLREKAAGEAKVIRKLDWPLVEIAGSGFDPKAAFTEVRLRNGDRGFIETAKLRGLLDYRLIADRQGDAWRLTALIAGD